LFVELPLNDKIKIFITVCKETRIWILFNIVLMELDLLVLTQTSSINTM